MTQRPKLFFIVGTGRTGSKIYMHSLRNEPNTVVIPEIKARMDYNPDIEERISEIVREEGSYSPIRLATALRDQELFAPFWKQWADGGWAFSVDEFAANLPERKPDAFGVIEAIAATVGSCLEADLLGFKFPVSVRHSIELSERFPNASILHLLRDPRATVASNQGKFKRGESPNRLDSRVPIPVPDVLGDWLLSFHKILDTRRAWKVDRSLKGEGSYRTVRFEDTIRNPRSEIKSIADFLGLEFRESMLDVPMADSSFESERKRGFDKSAIDRWKAHLDPLERKTIKLMLKGPMEEWGYSDQPS